MLFRPELRKILPYRTVWIILLAYAVLLLLFVGAGGSVTLNGQQLGQSLYVFPALWSKLAYVASYFTMLLGLLLIILITDEFQFRTFRQQVIDGASVGELVQGKLAVSGLLAGFAALVVLGVGFYFGLTRAAGTADQAAAGLPAVLLYGVQVLGLLSLAALVAVLVRRSGAAILVFLLYLWVAEPLLRLSLPDELDRYLPAKIFNSLTPMPGQELMDTVAGPSLALLPTQALPVALAYTALFWGLSYMVLRNRDL
ncbi:ABC transporter permease [Hymenobacter sediminicola]|uniref:ABC transporter permease n=1 Tax=Hymenobacter sediminicola TaxID=2761579 RepID=A0A7G7W2I7_9BACT|nr:ABC transporter permease [Hymenobacter sediminicola]QNH60580.1 ABC transporter permease [Hymenobacter sediminicola]